MTEWLKKGVKEEGKEMMINKAKENEVQEAGVRGGKGADDEVADEGCEGEAAGGGDNEKWRMRKDEQKEEKERGGGRKA